MKFVLKKQYLNYLYITIALFILLISKDIVRIFEPLYSSIYYGLLTGVFSNILSFLYVLIGTIIIIYKFKIKFNENYKLPLKNIFILYSLTLIPIIIMSATLGWEVKLFYDVGENVSGSSIYTYLSYQVFNIIKIFVATLILNFSHTFFENCITFNNEKIQKCFPFGGLVLFITFGILELILGIHYYPITYLLLNVYFGFIYLFSNKSFSKSYFLILLIYLL